MDIYCLKIVGFEVHDQQCSDVASQLINDICKAERVSCDKLTLHSDNGGPMKGATMLATLQRLGVLPSFSRPSVSNDNPFSKALFKTLKYCPQYPSKPFKSVADANAWAIEFVRWYNEEHLHSGIQFVTPGSRHRGEDIEILAKRREVYEEAKSKSPQRWSGSIRSWEYIGDVMLNCLKGKMTSCKTIAA
jgi:transposase InsO family protein